VKNLPHQINQLPRLNRALRVFVDLAAAGDDLEDQGVVGDALARSGAYTFRTPGDTPLEELLAAEHLKPIGSQGTRTAVRDLRRFFGLLGFVLRSEADGWLITDSARKLVDLQARSDLPRIRELWREALLDLALEDAGGTSHPYRILLRLVGEMPDLPKAYSGLCLEAVDDSAGEFARILQIARRANPPATMEAIAGRHNARNSTKILPPLAIQLVEQSRTPSGIQDARDDAMLSYGTWLDGRSPRARELGPDRDAAPRRGSQSDDTIPI